VSVIDKSSEVTVELFVCRHEWKFHLFGKASQPEFVFVPKHQSRTMVVKMTCFRVAFKYRKL